MRRRLRIALTTLAVVIAGLAGVATTGLRSAGAAASPFVGMAATPSGLGYWLVSADGAVLPFGDAQDFGSMAGKHLNSPVLGMAATTTGKGYWLVAGDGGLFTFGDAGFYGSTGGIRLNQPVVGLAPTPTNKGYWLFAKDGGVFTFGDALFFGSMGSVRLNQPVVGGVGTATGKGYWEVARDGGMFTFGDAPFLGSMGSVKLNQPVVGMSLGGTQKPSYRMVASDGGVFNFGAPFFGSGVGKAGAPVVGLANRPQGDGYWMVTETGSVLNFGAAPALGSAPPGAAPLATVKIAATPFVSGLSAPTAMTMRPGDNGAFYVTEQTGRVRVVRNGVLDPNPVLTLDASLIKYGGEQGLLGLAFSADGNTLFIDHNVPDGSAGGVIDVDRYTMNGNVANPATRKTLLQIPHTTYTNHNGGGLTLGPDGNLWISVGDGGGGGDPLHNAQNTNVLLGKLLRITPDNSARGYSIPAGNPFAGQLNHAQEIFAYGLRNPWRYSFDRASNDLWIADVGQDAWEEIDFDASPLTPGRNYGWPGLEGTHSYNGGVNPAGGVLPVYEYNHSGGDCSITGGYVYRGTGISGLAGAYVYGDYCSGRIGAIRVSGTTTVDSVSHILTVAQVSSFAQDANGELYALSLNGTIYRLTQG